MYLNLYLNLWCDGSTSVSSRERFWSGCTGLGPKVRG